MVQLGLPGTGTRAKEITRTRKACRSLWRASPHGARDSKTETASAIPSAPRPRDDRQLELWSYVVTGRQVDETGDVYHPDMPDDYPDRRPRTFAYCQCLGLGDRLPCAFATCRHSLLSDELRAEMLPDDDLWERETCSLAVAARRRHSSVEVAKITGHCESSIEESSRRSITAIKRGLGLQDCAWPPRNHGFKLDSSGCDGLAELVAKMPERPKLSLPTVKTLTRHEVAALYGAKMVHPSYGTAKP